MKYIWLTRGKSWGFRFLRDGGLDDPLPMYEEAFSTAINDSEVFFLDGSHAAVRFPDPAGRTDSAGRAIPHSFVIFDATELSWISLDDAIQAIWPQVAQEYSELWGAAL